LLTFCVIIIKKRLYNFCKKGDGKWLMLLKKRF
jgi:hypothetical protein